MIAFHGKKDRYTLPIRKQYRFIAYHWKFLVKKLTNVQCSNITRIDCKNCWSDFRLNTPHFDFYLCKTCRRNPVTSYLIFNFSYSGKAGNLLCGSFWYQYATDEISSSRCLYKPPSFQPRLWMVTRKSDLNRIGSITCQRYWPIILRYCGLFSRLRK